MDCHLVMYHHRVLVGGVSEGSVSCRREPIEIFSPVPSASWLILLLDSPDFMILI